MNDPGQAPYVTLSVDPTTGQAFIEGHGLTPLAVIQLLARALKEMVDPEDSTILANSQATCPECAAGKHANCDGGAWNQERDEPAICSCYRQGHFL